MKEGKCPLCTAKVPLGKKVHVNSIVYCPDCDAELQVVRTNPVELDWPMEAYEEEDEMVFAGGQRDVYEGYDDYDDGLEDNEDN